LTVIASTLVRAEVVQVGDPRPDGDEEEKTLDEFFERPFFIWVTVDTIVARHAAALERRCGLKPADAIHLASAVRGKADAFLTYDDRLLRLGALDGVTIEEPAITGQGELEV
jgi:predicted nucleic acid-binding protein